MTTRYAACSCGQLKVFVEEDPVRISMCHCLDCQRRTGSVIGVQAWFPKSGVSIDGQTGEFHRLADSGNRISYSFCPICASTVYYHAEVFPEWTAIPVGAFADPLFPAPRVSVYESRKHSWLEVPADIEHIE